MKSVFFSGIYSSFLGSRFCVIFSKDSVRGKNLETFIL